MTSKLPNNSSLWNTPIFLPLSLSVFLLISGFAVSPIWDPIILEIANTDSQQASYQWSFVDPAIRHSWTWWNSFTPLLWVSVLVTFLVIHTPSSVLVIHTPSSVLVILSVGFWDFSLTLHPSFLSSWFVLLVLVLKPALWVLVLGLWFLTNTSWSLTLGFGFSLLVPDSWLFVIWSLFLISNLDLWVLVYSCLAHTSWFFFLAHTSWFFFSTLHPSSLLL